MRRFTRLTNAFSKKVENHAHSVALHTMYYNFCRIHQSLKVTPAMEAGVTNRLFEIDDIIKLVDDAAPKPNRPKTYKKNQTDPLPNFLNLANLAVTGLNLCNRYSVTDS